MSKFWMQTRSDRAFHLDAPRSEDVDIGDIAHSLSMQCRFNGMCRDFESVALHSVIVENIFGYNNPRATAEERLGALLHDAVEAYSGDVISPMRRALKAEIARRAICTGLVGAHVDHVSRTFEDMEVAFFDAIAAAFRLDKALLCSTAVRTADLQALYFVEKPILFGASPIPWARIDIPSLDEEVVTALQEGLLYAARVSLTPIKTQRSRFEERYRLLDRVRNVTAT